MANSNENVLTVSESFKTKAEVKLMEIKLLLLEQENRELHQTNNKLLADQELQAIDLRRALEALETFKAPNALER